VEREEEVHKNKIVLISGLQAQRDTTVIYCDLEVDSMSLNQNIM